MCAHELIQITKVKTLSLLVATLFFSTIASHAGNMFGPAPFRNGSPLVTGVDGTYQATARSENVTGIFRFAYAGGSQTANARQNSWVFFVNGQVLRGTVEAALDNSSLSGILDSESSGITRDSNGAITLPIYIFSGANSAAGSFQGNLNLKSPSGAFSGAGQLLPTPGTTNQLTTIFQESFVNPVTGDVSLGPIESTNITYTNSGGSMVPVNFKFRGVRTSTSSTAVATPAN
jgi:hypothetical protein